MLWSFVHLNKFFYAKCCSQFSVLYLEASAIDGTRPTQLLIYRLSSNCLNIRDSSKHLNMSCSSSNLVCLWNAAIVNMRKAQHLSTCSTDFLLSVGASLNIFTQGYFTNSGNEYPLLTCQSYQEGFLEERNGMKNKEMNTKTDCKGTARIQKGVESKLKRDSWE